MPQTKVFSEDMPIDQIPGKWLVTTMPGEYLPTRVVKAKEVKGKRVYLDLKEDEDSVSFVLTNKVSFVCETKEDADKISEAFAVAIESRQAAIKQAHDLAREYLENYCKNVQATTAT